MARKMATACSAIVREDLPVCLSLARGQRMKRKEGTAAEEGVLLVGKPRCRESWSDYYSRLNHVRSCTQLGGPELETLRGSGKCSASIPCSGTSVSLGGQSFHLLMGLSVKVSSLLAKGRFVTQEGHIVPQECHPQEIVLISSTQMPQHAWVSVLAGSLVLCVCVSNFIAF